MLLLEFIQFPLELLWHIIVDTSIGSSLGLLEASDIRVLLLHVSFQFFNSVLHTFNMQFQLVLHANMLSNVCLQFLDYFFVHTWAAWTFEWTGRVFSSWYVRYALAEVSGRFTVCSFWIAHQRFVFLFLMKFRSILYSRVLGVLCKSVWIQRDSLDSVEHVVLGFLGSYLLFDILKF